MGVDNTKQIQELLNFQNKDAFYFVQVMQRRKDQPNKEDYPSDNILLKDYYIKSGTHYNKKLPEIMRLCHAFNARAYIRLNRCFFSKVGIEALAVTVEYLQKGSPEAIKAAYPTACGRRCYDPDKTWILDLDGEHAAPLNIQRVIALVNRARSSFFGKVYITTIQTVNGVHLITHPFDTRDVDLTGIDLHKNNPTLLYYAQNI